MQLDGTNKSDDESKTSFFGKYKHQTEVSEAEAEVEHKGKRYRSMEVPKQSVVFSS